ncbi:MAG TPA: MBL fold metallo-hydrolase [Stellaceae bacterium]|nr:MBL fold metallo-hydrolase [Stellaceae bacterium]
MAGIKFIRDFAFEYAVLETVSPLVRRIVARNPGPFTGPGTTTFVIGHGRVALIDPGPALAAHVDSVLDALRGETIEQILVTHTHLDHSPAAAAIKAATGAPTLGFGPHGGGVGHERDEGADHEFVPDRTVGDGDEIAGSGWRATAIHTPGHTSNHLCFALDEEGILFTGDHVMGWSTSIVSPPDGDMAAYRRSLAKLRGRGEPLWMPTHGPAIADPQPFLEALIEHRAERSDAVLARLKAGDRTIPQLVEAIYVGLDPRLRPAAGRSVLAHLIELIELGLVVREEDGYRPVR